MFIKTVSEKRVRGALAIYAMATSCSYSWKRSDEFCIKDSILYKSITMKCTIDRCKIHRKFSLLKMWSFIEVLSISAEHKTRYDRDTQLLSQLLITFALVVLRLKLPWEEKCIHNTYRIGCHQLPYLSSVALLILLKDVFWNEENWMKNWLQNLGGFQLPLLKSW